MSTLQTTTSTDKSSLSPAVGDTYFETDTKNIIVYDGTNWRGYQNDGAVGWTGSSAYSLSLDGTDDYASSLFAPSSIGTGNYSVSFWFNIDSSAIEDFPYFFLMGASTSAGSIYQGVGLVRQTSGTTYKVRINNNFSGSYSQTISSGFDISAGTWYHFVIVRSGSTMTLYKDGSSYLTLSNSNVGSNDLSNGSAFYLGWGAAAADRYVYGLLDEVAVFNSALTSTQAGYIYNGQTNSGSGTATSGVPGNLNSFSPLHWWRMGDNNNNTGSTIYDQGSGDKNLSVQNGSSGSTSPTYSANVPS